MFYEHPHVLKMRFAWKKSQKILDILKRLNQSKTWSTGSAGKGLDLNFAIIMIIGTADPGKRRCVIIIIIIILPQTQGGGVQSCWT